MLALLAPQKLTNLLIINTPTITLVSTDYATFQAHSSRHISTNMTNGLGGICSMSQKNVFFDRCLVRMVSQ